MFKNLFYSCIPKTLKNFVKSIISKKEEFEEYFKIVQEKFNEIPSDQEIASQECKQSQIKKSSYWNIWKSYFRH